MRILFYRFSLSDSLADENECRQMLYTVAAITEWQHTDQGRWVMQHAGNVRMFTSRDLSTNTHRVDVIGEIDHGPLLTEYALRWQIEQSW